MGPMTILALFVTLALCAVILGAAGFRRPPPGFEDKQCDSCKNINNYQCEKCEKCGEPLKDRWDES